MKRKFRDFIQNCIRRYSHSFRYEVHSRNSYFTGCEYKISCINFRIFESISRKSENYDLSVFFFFSLAALNYGHRRIVPGEMQIGAHSRLQFVTSFRTDFMQFIVEDDKDIQTR